MASAPPAGPSAKAPELAASKHSRSAPFHASTTIPAPATAAMPAKPHGNASEPARARTDSVLSAVTAMGSSSNSSDHEQPPASTSSSRRRGSAPNPAHQQRRRSLWLGTSGSSFDSDDADDEGRSAASPLAALRSRLAKTSASAARAVSKAVTSKSTSGSGAAAANVCLPAGRHSGDQPEMEAGTGGSSAASAAGAAAARLPLAPLAATTTTALAPPAAPPAAPVAVPVIHTVPRRPSGSRLAAAVAAAFAPAAAPATPPAEVPLPAPAPAPASSTGTATTSPSDNVPMAMLATRAATFHGVPSTSLACTTSTNAATSSGVIPRRKASGSHAPPLRRPASMVHDVSSPEFQHLAGIFGWDLASGRPDVRSPRPGSDSPPATAIPSSPMPTPSSAAGSVFQRRHQNDVNWWKSIEASYKKRASAASNGSASATPGVVPAMPTSAGRNSVRSSRAWPSGRVSTAGNVAGTIGSPLAANAPEMQTPMGATAPEEVTPPGESLTKPALTIDPTVPAAHSSTIDMSPVSASSDPVPPQCTPTDAAAALDDDVALLTHERRRQERVAAAAAKRKSQLLVAPVISLTRTTSTRVLGQHRHHHHHAAMRRRARSSSPPAHHLDPTDSDTGVSELSVVHSSAATASATDETTTTADDDTDADEPTAPGSDPSTPAPVPDQPTPRAARTRARTRSFDVVATAALPSPPAAAAPTPSPRSRTTPSPRHLPSLIADPIPASCRVASLPDMPTHLGFTVAEFETTVDVFAWAGIAPGGGEAASAVELVRRLTRDVDYEFLSDFFLVYRQFLDPLVLAKLLVLRLRAAVPYPDDDDERRVVRLRTFVVLRHWINQYYEYDFADNKKLRRYMSKALKTMTYMPVLMSTGMDRRMIRALKHLWIQNADQYGSARSPTTTVNGGTTPSPPSAAPTPAIAHVEFPPVPPPAPPKPRPLAAAPRSSIWSSTTSTSDDGPIHPPSRLQIPTPGSTSGPSSAATSCCVTPIAGDDPALVAAYAALRGPPILDPTAAAVAAAAGARLQGAARGVRESVDSGVNLSSRTSLVSGVGNSGPGRRARGARDTLLAATDEEDEDPTPAPAPLGAVVPVSMDSSVTSTMVTSALAARWVHVEDEDDDAEHRSLGLDAVADGRVLAPPLPTHASIPAPLVSPLMAVAAPSPPMAGAGRVKSVIALVPKDDGKPLPPPPLASTDQMFIRAPPRRVSSTPVGTPASSRSASPVLTPRPTARALTAPMRSTSPDSARSLSPSTVFMRRHRTASHASAATSSVAPATGSPSSSSGSGGGTSLSKEVKSAVGKLKSMFRKDKSGSKSPTSPALSPALTPQPAPVPISAASGSTPSVRGSPSVRSVRGSPSGRSSTTSPTVKGSPTLSTISTLALDPAMEARYPALAEIASEYMAGGGAATDKDDRGTARRRGTLRATPRVSAMSADSDDDMAAGGGTAPASSLGSGSPRPSSAPTPGGVASAVAAARAGAYSALARSSAALTAGTLAVPWVMRVRSAELAQHLSIVEQVRVRRIDWTELLDVAVGNHPLARATGNLFGGVAGTVVGPPDDVDNVRHVIEWFNLVCQWVSTQVLSVPEAALRAKVIEKLIKVAAKCAQYCNYSTLMAITLALQSPSVDRLKRTWARVAADKQATLADLVDLTSPFHNFRKLRAAMAEATSGVPFIGIFLSDLLINTEVPGTVAVSDLAPGSTDADGEEGARARHYRAVAAALTAVKLAPRSTLPDATVLVDLEPALTTLVNWQKFKTMTKVIKQFRTALEAPSYAVTGAWPLKEDVFWRILDVPNQVLDVHELEARSYQFEPSMRRSVVPPTPAATALSAGDE